MAVAALAAATIVAGVAGAWTSRGAATVRAATVRAPSVRLSASFSPERLGRDTTIGFGFEVLTPLGTLPSPVTGMRVLLPRGLSIADSELGLESCDAERLGGEGPSACPPDSPIGRGGAVAAVGFGKQLVFEHVAITLFAAPLEDGHPTMLVYSRGEHPVIANIVFPGAILPAQGPFGSLIDTSMPLVPGLPGGPDVAVVQLGVTIGPKGILYRERVKDRTISFRPKGVALPARCPPGGFAFTIALEFQDGAQTHGATKVACPHRRR